VTDEGKFEDWDWEAEKVKAIDLSDDAPSPKREDITPKDLLDFAKVCLFWSMFVFCLSGILRGFSSDFSEFFEKSSTVVPPIITLILGFYF